MGQYVISLWWHTHFEEHTIQSFTLACRPEEKPDTTVMYSGFTLQVSTGQSRWLTSMRGALSVTLQAFHYKNAWLLRYHGEDGECSCHEADWVKKETGFRTDYVKVTKVNLDTIVFVSPLSLRIADLVTVIWLGSSSNVSEQNVTWEIWLCRKASVSTLLPLCAEIARGIVKWHEWLGPSSHSNDKSRYGLALVTQPGNWWHGSM